ncbi:hypothetical protein O6H91_06G061500 [Diphasiastrum complanatum]|uniref:Uncharacterized protein n=1 Tax=Diphasiastrum complanatum TaxID=34168 RepID=A0ACC2DEQ7_DIPCM|nr:hypothetical protein O6H91_Y290600 [Diphasiastrum complanatum]KAJ7552607.1 hypothetical protein O6H91_06G061500 [Diphasiastrum complanatum]
MERGGRQLSSMLRGAVLRHLQIPSRPQQGAAGFVGDGWGEAIRRRFFSEEVHSHGTYLNKTEVTDRVLNVVKNFHKVDPSKVSPSSNFQKDLGLDSLDTVEVVMAFEEEFGVEIPDSEADKIVTCADAIDFIASQPQAK